MFMPQPSPVMNAETKHPSSSSSSSYSCSTTKTRKTEKTRRHHHHQTSSLKLIIRFKNSRPYAILPANKCNQSQKRKQPQKEINLWLSLCDQSLFNIKKNKKTKILDSSSSSSSAAAAAAAAYMGSKQSRREEIRVAKKLKSLSVYSHQEEQEERFMGISTKLTLLARAL